MPKEHERQPFYCPFPGCKRKFASLWRLKVHYRAPPNERGSGKERGHGVELPICPACGEELEPGKHHNKCKAGRTTNPPSKRAPKAAAPSGRPSKASKPGNAQKKRAVQHPAAAESNSGNSIDAAHAHGTVMYAEWEPAEGMAHAPAGFMPAPGFPTFGYGCMPSAHVLQHLSMNGYAPYAATAPSGGEGGADDAAADAAKTLYTIAKSEDDGGDFQNGAQLIADGVPVATGAPQHADGSKPAAVLHQRKRGRAADNAGAASGDECRQGNVDGGTADGVPVDALGAAAPPMFVSWATDGDGNAQPVQMVMTPQGLVPVMQCGQQVYMPMQAAEGPNGEPVTVMVPTGGHGIGAPPGHMAAGTPLEAPDHGGEAIGYPGGHEGGLRAGSPVLQDLRQHLEPAPEGTVDGVPARRGAVDANGASIPEDIFLDAVRMVSAAEASATS